MYGKIFASIYDGSLSEDWRALVTFQQMIVLCNADGILDMTPGAIAARTRIPIEHIKAGIEILESPDPTSRTPGCEGRRIERLDDHRDWGWIIVNHRQYRDLKDADEERAKTRERVRKHREKKRLEAEKDVTDVTDVTRGNAEKRHTDTDADTDSKNPLVSPLDCNGKGKRFPAEVTTCPPHWRTYCQEKRPDLAPDDVFEDFRDYWIAKSGKDGTKADWTATWRVWVRRQVARGASRNGGGWEKYAADNVIDAYPGESTEQYRARVCGAMEGRA